MKSRLKNTFLVLAACLLMAGCFSSDDTDDSGETGATGSTGTTGKGRDLEDGATGEAGWGYGIVHGTCLP